ncbi:unnamed protein product [Bathycoccus prasinos]
MSSREGVVTRARKRKLGQRDFLWDLIVNNDDICFKHIPPRLDSNAVKFLHRVNTETRKLIKRSSRESDLKKWFKVEEMSSISTLEVAWEHFPWGTYNSVEEEMDESYFCQKVAETNKLELLKWAREEKKCEWDERPIEAAASQGNLEMVKYCVANKCPIDLRACARATSGGHLEILKYLREEAKAPWASGTANLAAKNGHLHILEYLVERKFDKYEHWACENAAINGQLDCLKYSHETAKAPWNEGALEGAHENNHPECVQYCLDNDCPLPYGWFYEDGELIEEFYDEHHQLRGDDESHRRNNQTQSRCTPRDSALPPLDWHVYFPNVEYDVTSDRRCELASKLIDAFCLATNGAELFDQTKALHAKSIVIPFDYKALKCVLGDRVPDLFHALDLAPDEAFQALACAAHECLFYSLPKEERGRLIASGFKEKALEGVVLANGDDEMISRRNNRNVIGKECKVTCHVYNFSSKFKVRDFRELKSSWLGRVVQLKGVVQKAEATKPLCKSIFFKCEQCKESILVTLDKSGNFKAPANCETPKCRGKKGFTPDFERATTEDWRRVTLREEPNLGSGEGMSSSSDEEEDDDEEEEFDEEEEEEEDFEPLDDDEEGGRKKKKRRKQNRRKSADELEARTLDRAPKHIECELSETLVDRIETAGERVQVCGIVRREECEEQRGPSVLGGKKTGSAIQRLYVDAVSVMPPASATGSGGAGYQATNNNQTSTTNRKTETYQEIVKFSERCADDRLRVLVKSLCPSIYGHEIVKCGLLLCLFGGVRKADKSSKSSKNSSGKNNNNINNNKENNNANSVGAETSFDNDKENEENEGRQNESQRVHHKRRRSSLNAREQHQHKNHGAAGNETFARGTSHCLVVGDPGMGKSQMLRAASRVAPLAIHVSGKSASTAGLTATVSRDPTSGAPTFEAGAVALAHGGVCCVDEFDKMKSEHASLLEAMEQQRVSVNKGGARASLPARTTILAAANPHKGRYDRSKSVRENLKMSAPLLSRFDLVFVLTDDPDEERDKRIGDNVTRLCGGRKVDERTGKSTNLTFAEKFQLERNKRREAEAAAALTQQQRSSVSASETILTSAKKQASQRVFSLNKQEAASPDAAALMNLPPPSSSLRDGVGLKEYLERKSEEDVDDDDKYALYADYKRTSYDDMHSKDGIVSTSFMRKYVRYAKKYVHPTLSSDAKEVIKAFYLELRKNAPINDSAPVTARQLESPPRARVDLREIVTDRDAMDAVELYSLSMADVMRDDSGRLGAFGKRTGVSGKRKNFRVFIDAVNAATRNKGNAYFSVGELHALVEQTRLDGIKDIDAFIEALNLAGELLKCGRLYKSASSSSANTRKNTQKLMTSGEGVVTRMRKIEVRQRDSLWDLIVNNDDICFKHILPRLNSNDVKFLHGVNGETRKLIKRSSRKGDLREDFEVEEMSSISTLEVAFEHCPFWASDWEETDFCKEVARTNKLELLKWAREVKIEWDEGTITAAARQGNLEMVKYCVANECPIDEEACASAALSGHLEMLKYLHEEVKAPWDFDTAEWAAAHGHLHILEYLVERKYDRYDEYACSWAALYGQLDCLKYLHETAKAPWSSLVLQQAHDNEQPECIQYLLDNNCPLPPNWRYEGGTLYDEFYQSVGLREQ